MVLNEERDVICLGNVNAQLNTLLWSNYPIVMRWTNPSAESFQTQKRKARKAKGKAARDSVLFLFSCYGHYSSSGTGTGSVVDSSMRKIQLPDEKRDVA